MSAVRRVSRVVARVVPPLPSLPLAGRLPSARSVVNDNFDRARRQLENQRRFTLALLDAAKPVRRKIGVRKGPKQKSAEARRPQAPGR